MRQHQARVWDVGDLEYPVIREFLLGLPREQLEEVETNSKVRVETPRHTSLRSRSPIYTYSGLSRPGAVLLACAHSNFADLQHLKEDTDWLWEIFLLEDHPTQYERCNTKDGQPRTRGWRRMYRVRKLHPSLVDVMLTGSAYGRKSNNARRTPRRTSRIDMRRWSRNATQRGYRSSIDWYRTRGNAVEEGSRPRRHLHLRRRVSCVRTLLSHPSGTAG